MPIVRVGSVSAPKPALTTFRVRYAEDTANPTLPWVIDTGDGTDATRFTNVIVQVLGKMPQVLLVGIPPIGATYWRGSGLSPAAINSEGKLYGIIADAVPAAATQPVPPAKK